MIESDITDITDVIADLVLQAEPDLMSRFAYQAEALREVKCLNPVIGRWLAAVDLNYLLSVLALHDKDFADMFPGAAHTTMQERRQFSAALDAHMEQCPACALAHGYDLELDARLEQACQQNNKLLLQILDEDESDSVE